MAQAALSQTQSSPLDHAAQPGHFEQKIPCLVSGSIVLSRTYEGDPSTSMTFEGTATAQSCVESPGAQIDGKLAETGTLTSSAGSKNLDETEDGQFVVTDDAGSLECPIAIDGALSMTPHEGGFVFTFGMKGTICSCSVDWHAQGDTADPSSTHLDGTMCGRPL